MANPRDRGARVGVAAFFVALGFLLAMAVVIGLSAGWPPFARVGSWHDPVLTYFNLSLLAGAVLMAPFVAWRYFATCAETKATRLAAELGRPFTPAEQQRLDQLHDIDFGTCAGSVLGVMFVVAIGGFALLFLNVNADRGGVDYSLGANPLLLGGLIFADPASVEVQGRLAVALAAFQFGFLGAFVFFLIDLVRSYYTLDLTPHTFVDGTVRMTVASLVALVLSFLLVRPEGDAIAASNAAWVVPPVAFMLGMFPRRALLVLDRWVTRLLPGLSHDDYARTPLTTLPGMSPNHELRLIREGFDNVENIAHGEPFDLALRTGLNYGQLRTWIEQAALRDQLGSGYAAFVEATGLRERDGVRRFCEMDPRSASELLAARLDEAGKAKLDVLAALYAELPPVAEATRRAAE